MTRLSRRLSGHVAGDDAAGEALDDGGFADAGFADQYGVVLGAAAEHLDDAANLFVAADDGVELAAAREFGEIFSVLFEGLEFALGILVGDALRSADGGERLQDGILRGAGGDKGIARGVAFLVRDAEQHVLGGDILVFEVCGFAEGLLQRLVERLAQTGLRGAPATRGSFSSIWCSSCLEPLGGHTDLFEDGGDHALAVFDQRQQEVTGCNSGLPSSAARDCACWIACCDLTVSFSQRMAMEIQLLAASS